MKEVTVFFVWALSVVINCENNQIAYQYLPPVEEVCTPVCPVPNVCTDIGCVYGFDPLSCTCCGNCLKGPFDCCGGQGGLKGNCTEGFECTDENYQTIPVSLDPETAVGVCRSSSCPDCRLVRCATPDYGKCKRGVKLDPFCGCCSFCARGEGEKCGGSSSFEGVCEDDLECVDENNQSVYLQGPDPPAGTCVNLGGPAFTPCDPKSQESDDCSRVFCFLREEDLDCPFGITYIGCCPTCILGPDEVSEPKITQGKLIGERLSENIGPTPPLPFDCTDCAAILCLSAEGLGCKYGATTDPVCGCCPVCLRGPGDRCGGFSPIPDVGCGKGLRCFVKNVDKIPDAPGVCVPFGY